MMIRHTIAAVAASLVLAAPLAAGETRTDEIGALTQAQEKLAQAEKDATRVCRRKPHAYTGKAQQNTVLRCRRVAASQRAKVHGQYLEVQDLLNQLEAGRDVDPADVDRVLREAEQRP